jgi:hypothetical protein
MGALVMPCGEYELWVGDMTLCAAASKWPAGITDSPVGAMP